MVDISDWAVFARAAELGSLSAAGRDLRLSAAVVSNRLAKLEKHLGVRLLNRSGDCFRLSKLDYAEIDSIEAAIDELRQQAFIEYNAPLEAETLLSLFTS